MTSVLCYFLPMDKGVVSGDEYFFKGLKIISVLSMFLNFWEDLLVHKFMSKFLLASMK